MFVKRNALVSLGVFFVLDVVGAIGDQGPNYDARSGPLELSAQLVPIMDIPMLDEIEPPLFVYDLSGRANGAVN